MAGTFNPLPSPQLEAPTKPQGFIESVGTGLDAGVRTLRSAAHGVAATGGALVGADQFSEEQILKSQEQTELASQNGPRITDITQIKGIQDIPDYLGGLIGQQLPIMATLALGGPAALGARALVAKGVSKTAALAVGIGTAGSLLETGLIFPEVVAEAKKNNPRDLSLREQAGVSITGGVLAGAPEALPIFNVANKLGFGSTARKAIRRNIMGEIAKQGGQQALLEGGTEGLQTIIERGSRKFVNDNFEIFDEEGRNELINAIAGGAIIGGGLGGASAGIQTLLPGGQEDSIFEDLEIEDEQKNFKLNNFNGETDNIRASGPADAAKVINTLGGQLLNPHNNIAQPAADGDTTFRDIQIQGLADAIRNRASLDKSQIDQMEKFFISPDAFEEFEKLVLEQDRLVRGTDDKGVVSNGYIDEINKIGEGLFGDEVNLRDPGQSAVDKQAEDIDPELAATIASLEDVFDFENAQQDLADSANLSGSRNTTADEIRNKGFAPQEDVFIGENKDPVFLDAPQPAIETRNTFRKERPAKIDSQIKEIEAFDINAFKDPEESVESATPRARVALNIGEDETRAEAIERLKAEKQFIAELGPLEKQTNVLDAQLTTEALQEVTGLEGAGLDLESKAERQRQIDRRLGTEEEKYSDERRGYTADPVPLLNAVNQRLTDRGIIDPVDRKQQIIKGARNRLAFMKENYILKGQPERAKAIQKLFDESAADPTKNITQEEAFLSNFTIEQRNYNPSAISEGEEIELKKIVGKTLRKKEPGEKLAPISQASFRIKKEGKGRGAIKIIDAVKMVKRSLEILENVSQESSESTDNSTDNSTGNSIDSLGPVNVDNPTNKMRMRAFTVGIGALTKQGYIVPTKTRTVKGVEQVSIDLPDDLIVGYNKSGNAVLLGSILYSNPVLRSTYKTQAIKLRMKQLEKDAKEIKARVKKKDMGQIPGEEALELRRKEFRSLKFQAEKEVDLLAKAKDKDRKDQTDALLDALARGVVVPTKASDVENQAVKDYFRQTFEDTDNDPTIDHEEAPFDTMIDKPEDATEEVGVSFDPDTGKIKPIREEIDADIVDIKTLNKDIGSIEKQISEIVEEIGKNKKFVAKPTAVSYKTIGKDVKDDSLEATAADALIPSRIKKATADAIAQQRNRHNDIQTRLLIAKEHKTDEEKLLITTLSEAQSALAEALVKLDKLQLEDLNRRIPKSKDEFTPGGVHSPGFFEVSTKGKPLSQSPVKIGDSQADILEGDKRYSALNAKLSDGRSIEEAYQLDIKGYRAKGNKWQLGKGKPPLKGSPAWDARGTVYNIAKDEIERPKGGAPASQAKIYKLYKDLWRQWAEENPTALPTLAKLSKGKILHDTYATTSINQARALAELLLDPKLVPITPDTAKDKINFEVDFNSGYAPRTRLNASADATIAIAVDFNSGGEKLTKRVVKEQNKLYIPINIKDKLTWSDTGAKAIVDHLNEAKASSLNIAGNGIYTMKGKYTQEQLDKFTYQVIKSVVEHPELENTITFIRSGGQTGIDEAGAKAGMRLGIPTTVLAPKGWKFRDITGKDISSKDAFMERFAGVQLPVPTAKEKVEVEVEVEVVTPDPASVPHEDLAKLTPKELDVLFTLPVVESVKDTKSGLTVTRIHRKAITEISVGDSHKNETDFNITPEPETALTKDELESQANIKEAQARRSAQQKLSKDKEYQSLLTQYKDAKAIIEKSNTGEVDVKAQNIATDKKIKVLENRITKEVKAVKDNFSSKIEDIQSKLKHDPKNILRSSITQLDLRSKIEFLKTQSIKQQAKVRKKYKKQLQSLRAERNSTHNKEYTAALKHVATIESKLVNIENDLIRTNMQHTPDGFKFSGSIADVALKGAAILGQNNVVQEMMGQERVLLDKWSKALKIQTPKLVSVVKDSIRGLSDSKNNIIALNNNLTDAAVRVETLAHEVGHIILDKYINSAPKEQVAAIHKEFNAWRDKQLKDNPTVAAVNKSKKTFNAAMELLTDPLAEVRINRLNKEQLEYVLDFHEWFADQTSRYLTNPSKAEGFFQNLARNIKEFFGIIENNYNSARSVQDLLEGIINTNRQSMIERFIDATAEAVKFPKDLLAQQPAAVWYSAGLHAKSPFSEAGATAFAKVFQEELDADTKLALSKAVNKKGVKRKLYKLLEADAMLITKANNNEAMKIAYAYQAYNAKQLKLSPEAVGILQRLYDFIHDLAGVLQEHKQAKRMFEFIRDPNIGASKYKLRENISENMVQKSAQAAIKIYDKLIPYGEAIFSTADSRMHGTGNPYLIRIANMINARTSESEGVPEAMLEGRKERVGEFVNRWHNLYNKVSEADAKRALELLQNKQEFRITSNKDPAKQLARATHNLLFRMRKYGERKGLEIGDRGSDYFPWVFDVKYVQENSDKFMDLLNQPAYIKPIQAISDKANKDYLNKLNGQIVNAAAGKADKTDLFTLADLSEEELRTPEKIKQQILATLIGENGLADTDINPNIFETTPYMASIQKRSLGFLEKGTKENQAELAKFFDKNIDHTMTTYIQQMVKRAEYVSRFGTQGQEFKALLDQALEYGATEKELDLAGHYLEASLGTLGTGTNAKLAKLLGNVPVPGQVINPKLQVFQSAVILSQNMAVLSLATFTSLVDPMGIGVRGGSINEPIAAFKAGMSEVFAKTIGDKEIYNKAIAEGKTEKEAKALSKRTVLREMAEALGTIEDKMTDEALAWEYETTWMSPKIRWVNDKFFKVIGLTQWTRFTRMMALGGADAFLRKHMAMDNDTSDRYMKELGLLKGDIKVQTIDGKKSVKLLSNVNRDKLLAQGSDKARAAVAADDRIRTALNRFVDESILRPNSALRPIWASDPHYALIFHLKSFMYGFHERIIRRSFNELKEGQLAPMMMLMMFVPMMLMADLLRDAFTGFLGKDLSYKSNWGIADYTWNAMQRSGVTGLGQMVIEAQQNIKYGGIGIESMLGPASQNLIFDNGNIKIDDLFFNNDRGMWATIRDNLPLHNSVLSSLPKTLDGPFIDEGLGG